MELVEAPGPVEERVPALVVGEVLRGTGVRHELHRPVRADLIEPVADVQRLDRKSTRLHSTHRCISDAAFCLKKKEANFPFCSPLPEMSGRPRILPVCTST